MSIGAGAEGGGGEGGGVEGGGGAEVSERLVKLAEEVAGARRMLERLELRQRVSRAVEGAGAAAPGTVAALVEAELSRLGDGESGAGGADDGALAGVIEGLRQRRPWLFARGAGGVVGEGGVGSSMAPMARGGGGGVGVGGSSELEAARRGAATGDRAAMLRYLRARRG